MGCAALRWPRLLWVGKQAAAAATNRPAVGQRSLRLQRGQTNDQSRLLAGLVPQATGVTSSKGRELCRVSAQAQR